MRQVLTFLTAMIMAFMNIGCSDKSYPENMTNKEKKAYYKEFNESKTDAEWDKIRTERKSRSNKKLSNENEVDVDVDNDTIKSISFSVKNNSVFSKKLKIVDNILDFKPFEKRFFGFKADTKVYLLKGEKEEYLFTITENDEGKEIKINE